MKSRLDYVALRADNKGYEALREITFVVFLSVQHQLAILVRPLRDRT
mgnify:FL=1